MKEATVPVARVKKTLLKNFVYVEVGVHKDMLAVFEAKPEFLGNTVLGLLQKAVPAQQSTPLELSERQRQILGYLAAGLPYKRIAQEIGLSERTVAFHADAMKTALGADSLAHAVAIGYQRGIL